MNGRIRRLELVDSAKPFDCGDEPLNTYFKYFAIANQEKHKFGVTYVAVSAAGDISGYYTLAATSIVSSEVVPALQGAPKYPAIPALLLGRLAVALSIQRNGTGSQLMRHCLETALEASGMVGARLIITDAYPSAVEWYRKFGFIEINPQVKIKPTSIRMIIDLRTIRKAVAINR